MISLAIFFFFFLNLLIHASLVDRCWNRTTMDGMASLLKEGILWAAATAVYCNGTPKAAPTYFTISLTLSPGVIRNSTDFQIVALVTYPPDLRTQRDGFAKLPVSFFNSSKFGAYLIYCCVGRVNFMRQELHRIF